MTQEEVNNSFEKSFAEFIKKYETNLQNASITIVESTDSNIVVPLLYKLMYFCYVAGINIEIQNTNKYLANPSISC